MPKMSCEKRGRSSPPAAAARSCLPGRSPWWNDEDRARKASGGGRKSEMRGWRRESSSEVKSPKRARNGIKSETMFRTFLMILIPYALVLSALLWRKAPVGRKGKGVLPAAGEPMRLLVIGATGGTGRELIQQALAQGHQVTAF